MLTFGDLTNYHPLIISDILSLLLIYLIEHKNDVIVVLKMFFAFIERQLDASIKTFKFDNGGELINKKLSSLIK